MMINEDFLKKGKTQDIGRWHITQFVKEVAQSLPPASSILDAGAGECVYKRYFSHCKYKAIDLAVGESRWNYSNIDYFAALHDMPIADESFDAVLCTQVLEHLEWPRESVAEMYRVLKYSGQLFITVPMAQGEHQIPYDFFRYTSYGLYSICKEAGFSKIHIKPFGGLWTRWAYELPQALSLLPSWHNNTGTINLSVLPILPMKIILKCFIILLQYIFLMLDQFDKEKIYPFGWSVIAVK